MAGNLKIIVSSLDSQIRKAILKFVMDEHPLETQATQAALEADWEKAITLNKELLKENPENLGAYNRLGRAYSEIGQIERAKSSYREVLRHDPYNSIALKNLERLKAANGHSSKITGSTALNPDLFLESPGKTKVLELTGLAEPEILATLHTGDNVKISGLQGAVKFEDASGRKLGLYEGEFAAKLSEMLTSGCVYEAYVKSARPTELKIFVREVQLSPRFSGKPSFPITDSGFKPYVHESAVNTDPIIHDGQEEVMPSSEEEPGSDQNKKTETKTLAEADAEETEQD